VAHQAALGEAVIDGHIVNLLKMIDKEVLKEKLRARREYQYDQQTDGLIDQASYLFPLSIADQLVFENLIPCTWVFTENERPRTLERLVGHLRESNLTWGQLAEQPPSVQNGEWYQRVQAIYDKFDWKLMGPLFVTPVKGWRQRKQDSGFELAASPTASLSIVNGVHCSLAAMTMIDANIGTFLPVEAILVLPRVDY
jgi:hypothetical protein